MKHLVKNILLWMGEHRISSQVNEITFEAEGELKDTTNCESGDWDEEIVGTFKSNVAYSGCVQIPDAVPTVDEGFESAQFADLQARTVLPTGWVKASAPLAPEPGDRFWMTVGQHASAVIGGKVKDLFPLKVKVTSGRINRGEVLEFVAGPVTTHESDPLEFGAIAEGEVLAIFVSIQKEDPDDPGTLDLLIESDEDGLFATPTTRATVPQASGAAFYYTEIDGPITDDNFRVNAVSADADDFSYVVALAKYTAS